MTSMQALISRQRQFFDSGKTRPLEFRAAQLKKLKAAMKEMEPDLLAALKQDLGKSEFEGYTSEIGFTHEEINHTIKHLADWARPRRVGTPIVLHPAQSTVFPQPKGVVLIISPWNYPFQLLMSPLVASIAAGNCAVLKPSEIAPATAKAVERLVERIFSPEYCAVVGGGVPETTALLAERFDHIFFTGSIPVGRIVLRAAAEHLTPVTLELGGKSPCIIDKDVDVAVAARRITWGKYFNAGQTCVAPDYLLVHKDVKKDLMAGIKQSLKDFFGDDPKLSPDYPRIVSERHFDRLVGLLGEGETIIGGTHDRSQKYIAPTVVGGVTLKSKVMEDEIFGPILPVLEIGGIDEAMAVVRERPNPLALYVFSKNDALTDRVVDEIPFGGGCVNNALIHLANPNLPFGGIGQSGMGAYHGKTGFDTFSHMKAVVKTPMSVDIKLKYPPYGKRLGLIKKLMR